MDSARIAALLAPYLGGASLSPGRLSQISTYIDLLTRWNARISLTAIRDPGEIVTRHFGESFFCARHLFPDPSSLSSRANPGLPLAEGQHESRDLLSVHNTSGASGNSPEAVRATHSLLGTRYSQLADLGSGAGFPGLPIKLWAPELRVTLIESHRKKATFLREVIRAIKSTDIDVFSGRAEDLATGRESPVDRVADFDVVTLRAVEHFDRALATAASLVCPRGRLALLIGEAQASRLPTLAPAFTWQPPLPIPNSRRRLLTIGSKGR